MIDNDQSTIIEAPEVYKSIPTHFPIKTNDRMYLEKNVNFDTFDVHVMVNFIEPNFQNIIFTLSTVSLDHSEMIFGPFEKCKEVGRYVL